MGGTSNPQSQAAVNQFNQSATSNPYVANNPFLSANLGIIGTLLGLANGQGLSSLSPLLMRLHQMQAQPPQGMIAPQPPAPIAPQTTPAATPGMPSGSSPMSNLGMLLNGGVPGALTNFANSSSPMGALTSLAQPPSAPTTPATGQANGGILGALGQLFGS